MAAPSAGAGSSGRITGYFHEKAAPVKPFFLVVPTIRPTADQREAQLAFGLSFIERFFVQPSIQPIADQREAHNAAAIPEFSNHRLALLPSALFVELWLRCQLGVLNWKRVLPSRSRTECLCFQ
jgi:hypothetical protein